MMRKIKFRAWVVNPRRGTYSYSDKPLVTLGKKEMIKDIFVLDKDNLEQYLPFDNCDSVEFMQFTGLKDKNGKEIYEGDIVLQSGVKYEVIFNKGCFLKEGIRPGFSDKSRFMVSESDEIIGNIYEDKHLLGDEK